MATSLEVQGIIRYLGNTGTPHKVTSTCRSGAITNAGYVSNHAKAGTEGCGLAVDFAGPSPSRDSPELLAIFAAFGPREQELSELIYSGAPYSIKNGRRVPRYAVADHWDHVHVAVPLGTFLSPQTPEVPVEPIAPEHERMITAFAFEGGYVLVAASGAVYCFGCQYKGGLRWDGAAWVVR